MYAFFKRKSFLFCNKLSNIAKFIDAVILKRHMKSNTGTKSGIFLQKMLHFICVSGKNDNNIISMIFHFLNYGVNSFITVRTVSIIHKGIRFVNE